MNHPVITDEKYLIYVVIDVQISHKNTHGHSGMSTRGGMGVAGNQAYSSTNGGGGSVPGILLSSAATGNRMAVPGFGVSPVLGCRATYYKLSGEHCWWGQHRQNY